MASLAQAVQAIDQLIEARIIADYAIAGAMAQIFWTEAIPTFDLDILVLPPQINSPLVDLKPLYPIKAEHIVIGEVPVQFMPAFSDLAEEAIKKAKTLDYSGLPIKVVTPEYLIALALEGSAKTYRRKERAYMLRETAPVDPDLLRDLMERYNLSW